MDGPQNGSGRFEEEILLPSAFEAVFLVRSVGSVFTVFAELSQLRDLCSGNCFVKFTLEQATKAQKGSRGIALLFL